MCEAFVDKFDPTLLATDWTSETELKGAFFKDTATPNYNSDTAYGTGTWASGNEASGAGYTAGGPVLTGTTLVIASGRVTFDANNILIADSTIEARGYLLYDSVHSNRALAAIDFGLTQETQDGDYLVTHDSLGILYFDLVP
ncbi:hypothetical protein ACIBG7_18570 [Nonomuraea sp. NPDC050328]|uniref:hypothetical protein n=1 Tax=Nonomuraea sp. NPDC050328 TaxID=3364361 RepID=UPI0037B55AFA